MKATPTILFAALMIAIVALAPADGQIFKTSLKVTVINELGNTEEGAMVQLFTSDKDYKEETNAATEAVATDAKGRATFKNLKSIVYYVNVEKGDKNNFGAGVQTDKLVEGKVNKVNIVIE